MSKRRNKESDSSSYELFSGKKLERDQRIATRPLEGVSDYVVESLPKILKSKNPEAALLEFEAQVLSQAQDIVNQLAEMPEKELKLARLDLLMLEAAFRHFNLESPALEHILAVLEELTLRPRILTYEDIVLNNPATDVRTFTDGKVGRHEADFYIGHNIIEGKLGEMYVLLQAARLGNLPSLEINGFMKQSIDLMQQVIELTQQIGFAMDIEAFRKFRQYIGSKSDQDGQVVLKGPSGAFSAKVPIIDVLISGDLSEEHRQYVTENAQYFPKAEIELLLEVLELGLTPLAEILAEVGADPELATDLLKRVKQFRGMHLRAVKNQVPEIFDGKGSGTGGESDVQGFLKRRINDY